MEDKFKFQIVYKLYGTNRIIFAGTTNRHLEDELSWSRKVLVSDLNVDVESIYYEPINSINNEPQEKK